MKVKKETTTTTTITRDCGICANEYSYDSELIGRKNLHRTVLSGRYQGFKANRFICSVCSDYLINYPDTLSCVRNNNAKIVRLELMVEKLNDQLDREVALRLNKPRIRPIWTCLAFGFSVVALLAASHINIWGLL